ncbi:MAG TPA: cobyrinate a,c-diamide synthase [Alphaproteobacteria bacterium]|nr:cobyrinate a,c-diamide synthase [Alphaproteobacteria bacterium]
MLAPAPGLVIAAPASGSGKTLLTLALLAALRRAGVRVAAAKTGPDFIDPSFHEAASGRPCLNLDPWAMRSATLDSLIARLGKGADLVLCEGVMGLFDGVDAAGRGSTADLAARAGWPVVLVVDARGQAASVAALVAGFARHRADVDIVGVILNRVGGVAHAALLREALAAHLPAIALLGAVPRRDDLALPSRHLGLVQAREHGDLTAFIERAAAAIGERIDLAGLMRLARPPHMRTADAVSPLPPLGSRIAVARDDAFAFAYAATLDSWRAQGAALSHFSPLADEPPAADADAVYLPGGYPELHSGALAGASRFLTGLRQAAARGAIVYGECGGYMTLGQGLVDQSGTKHAMAGLLPLESSFAARRLHLGYRAVRLIGDVAWAGHGEAFRGHEFHFASVVDEGKGEPLFASHDARGAPLGPTGRRVGRVMGSFVHLVDRA